MTAPAIVRKSVAARGSTPAGHRRGWRQDLTGWAFAAPFVILFGVFLALPILDTSFVILKRLKYRQPIYQADRWHFHHRLANVGLSQRRTALSRSRAIALREVSRPLSTSSAAMWPSRKMSAASQVAGRAPSKLPAS